MTEAHPRPSRRSVLAVAALAALAAAGALTMRAPPEAPDPDAILAADAAHRALRAGEIVLVDIRTPREWARTGIPEGAHPLDMRRSDFEERLRELAPEGRKVALICAAGVRSARLARRLDAAGIEVVDVSEGMMGSPAGPGWLARGLPVSPAGDITE